MSTTIERRTAEQIGRHVNASAFNLTYTPGHYLGVIVAGSVETGEWTVERPSGKRTVFEGPELIEAEDIRP